MFEEGPYEKAPLREAQGVAFWPPHTRDHPTTGEGYPALTAKGASHDAPFLFYYCHSVS